MALAVGPQGCVLALEPNPHVFEVLKKNADLNAAKPAIVPLMFAATEESGDFAFEYRRRILQRRAAQGHQAGGGTATPSR